MSAQIICQKGEDYRHLDIRLKGDLDGSSAAELANLIVGRFRGNGIVRVDTGSVGLIHPFGVAVLRKRLAAARLPLERLVFQGGRAAEIAPDGCPVEEGKAAHEGCGCNGRCAHCTCAEREKASQHRQPQ
ncbi:MAG: STAS domain-containing protein [Deltaproteobacteria bacterium]|nr:STAS domain-containing protein [Deltaproteobacteria bacterium]